MALVLAPPALASAGLPMGLDDAAPTLDEHATRTVYLDIVVDGQVVRPLVRFKRSDDELLVQPGELEAAGLVLPPSVVADSDGYVALSGIANLAMRYDESLQRVVLMPPREMRRVNRIGYSLPEAVTVDRDQGLVLDWDTYARHIDDRDTLSLGTSLRWFGRFGSLQMSGVSHAGDGDEDAYSRLDTRWTYSDPQRMWTWSAGDVISGGLAWTRPVRLGGVQWRRDFGVRPDLVVYPLPEFSADATVPSSVELYVNNVRQYTGEVDPGPFVLSEFPRVVGAGQAVVVVTDALGRTTQTSVSLYADYQRLARGLSDFSVEAGLLRNSYGVSSDDYGNDPVASASWRRGVTDNFTFEAHGEAGAGLRMGGAGLAWSPLGRYGVFTAAYSRSEDGAAGDQFGGGYQWFGQYVGFDTYSQRTTSNYRDLGSIENGSRPLREQDRASMWVSVPRGSLSFSWLRYRDHDQPSSRTVGIGFSQSYQGLSFSISAFDDSRVGHGASLSVSVPFGDSINSSISVDRNGGETRTSAGLRRNAPYAGGWGWDAQARDDGDGQLGASYRGSIGDVWFGIDRSGDDTGAFAQGNGSVVWMGGEAFASRTINDSFAVVSTNGIADVPILFENRVAGSTNKNGYLLLADLRGWQRNRLAIDPDGLPANLEVPAIERLVTPADHGGVRVKFALNPVRSSTVVLLDGEGQPVEAGTRVLRGDGSEAILGFDGELWLERYVDGETLKWRRAGVACTAQLPPLPDVPGAKVGPTSCNAENIP